METWDQLIIAIAVVSSLVGFLLWARRRGWATFGGPIGPAPREKSMRVLERVTVTHQHSLVLVEIESKRMLVCLSPGGSTVTCLDASK